MLELVLAAGAVLCAILAISAPRLILSAIWLAGASACVAILLYSFGAFQVAVIELSVGAGLVTVLCVFAISMAGEEAMAARTLVPRPLAAGLVLISVLLLAWMNLPLAGILSPQQPSTSFTAVLWQQRGLDVLVQVALIFSGVLGALGLLAERVRVPGPAAEPAPQPQSEIRPEVHA